MTISLCSTIYSQLLDYRRNFIMLFLLVHQRVARHQANKRANKQNERTAIFFFYYYSVGYSPFAFAAFLDVAEASALCSADVVADFGACLFVCLFASLLLYIEFNSILLDTIRAQTWWEAHIQARRQVRQRECVYGIWHACVFVNMALLPFIVPS